MDINKIIEERRAYPPKFLTDAPIDQAVIHQLLENANWAPTHKKTEPWRFIVYQNEARLKLADEIYRLLMNKISEGAELNQAQAEKLRDNLKRVPVVMVIVMQRDQAERLPEWEEIAAVSMAVQNMWLTATALDLGAFWATPYFMNLFQELFELHPGQRALGFFYVGKPAMPYPSPGRNAVENKVTWK